MRFRVEGMLCSACSTKVCVRRDSHLLRSSVMLLGQDLPELQLPKMQAAEPWEQGWTMPCSSLPEAGRNHIA